MNVVLGEVVETHILCKSFDEVIWSERSHVAIIEHPKGIKNVEV